MKCWVFDANRYLLYSFCDEGDDEACALCESFAHEGLCRKSRHSISRTKNSLTFHFCMDQGITRKHAKHITKMVVDGYFRATTVQKSIQNDIKSIESITLHNVKKLNAGIGLKIERHFSDEFLATAKDKIGAIEGILKTDSKGMARELLSIVKSIRQIESEYSLVESLREQHSTNATQSFTRHKAHTVILMSYYMFEEELARKHIHATFASFSGYILVDFAVARSAISQIFSNAVKYCKPDSEIRINFHSDAERTKVIFLMESRFIPQTDIQMLFLRPYRGNNTDGIRGEGIGLFAAYSMMKMNEGEITCTSNESTKYESEGVWYSSNTFTVTFKTYRPGG